MEALGSPHMDCRQDGAQFDLDTPSGYICNTPIAEMENADVILLVGTNPRWEAPMLNARIRKAFVKNPDVKIAVIGEQVDLNYPYEYLGAGADTLAGLTKSKSDFVKALKKAERPVMILGAGALARKDGQAIQALAAEVAEKLKIVKKGWNGFNVLQTAASRVGALLMGFVPQKGGFDAQKMLTETKTGKIKALYLMGADELPFKELSKKAFVIYQGHHGDHGAIHADVILPSAAYTEKNAIYINTEGRPQIARQAVFPPGEAREDWKIIRALSEIMGETLPYDNLSELRQAIVSENPDMAAMDQPLKVKWSAPKSKGKVLKAPLASLIKDFYKTNAICRVSKTMEKCSDILLNSQGKKTGTNG